MKISTQLRKRLFDDLDYREFLKIVLEEHHSVKGYRSQLSAHAGCQLAYLSQVMAEKAELTPEHAERLCSFWGLSEVESDYFFHLVLLGRAGTVSLRKRLEEKLHGIREAWKKERANYGKNPVQESEKALIYYAQWLHSAVHILLTIPSLQNEKALAKHLNQKEQDIFKILKNLERAGLVEMTSRGWRALQVQIHAGQESFFAEIHHKNWRAQALEVRNKDLKNGVRYTSVHSLSEKDFLKIQSLIEEMIQNSRVTIENSPEEMGACLLIDYFGF